MKKLKLFSLALMALFSTNLWAVDPTQIYANGYENGQGTWSGQASVTSSTATSRTGSKSILVAYTGSNSEKNATQNTGSSQQSSSSVYCHVIGWVKAEAGSKTTARIGFNSSKKMSSAQTIPSDKWTCLSYYGNNLAPSTIIVYKGGASGVTTGVYFDDIVAYYSESSTTDLTAPSAATNAVPTVASISWTNGEDTGTGATGIQNTLIWRRTSGSANDLTLNDQGIYSLTSTEGPNKDQSGHWTLVSASVAADAESYSGTFTPGDVYAIVHRDLAYNYSTPTYVTIPAAGDFTVIYKAGAGTGTDVEVQHAVTVADCPNTFSYANHVFNGWKDSGNNDVAVGSIVSSDMTLTAQWKQVYTITYANGGGSGDAPAAVAPKAQGETFEVAENTFTAPTGKDFDKWNDGTTDYDPGDTYTVGTANVTLTAVWKDRPVSTDATLSALSVTGCTLNETFDPATEDYTVDLPFYASMPKTSDVTATKNDEHAADPEVSIAGNVITIHCVAEDGKTEKDYTVTITIAPVPTASTSINIEQLVKDYGKSYKIADALTAANIVTDGRNGLDSIDESKDYRNYAFWGLKLKKNDADILKVIVPAGKVLNIKIGSIGAAVNVLINNEAYTTIAADKNKINHFFHLDATENPREVIFHTTANETTTLQQVKIGEECDDFTLPALYTVTYNAGAGTCAKASDFIEFAGETVTLPAATPATGYTFDGWFTAASEGTLVGAADAKVALTKDSTLYAQYSLVDYDVTYTAPTNGSYTIKVGDAAAVSESTTANYNQTITLAVASTDEGYRFNGWTVTNDETSQTVTVASNEFTMPAADVTVSATFAELFDIICATGLENGSVSADKAKAIAGEEVTLTASPSDGYQLYAFKVVETANPENDVTATALAGTTLTMPDFGVTVSATFSKTTGINDVENEVKAVKFLENGQLFIRRGEKVYTITGELVK